MVKPFTIAGFIQKITAVVDKFNRRQFERYETDSLPLTIRFNAHSAKGQLIDISLRGLLSIFRREAALPHVLGKVSIDLELENNMTLSGMEGFVIRIQAAEAYIDSEYIKFVVKFINLNPAVEKEFSNYLKRVRSYHW